MNACFRPIEPHEHAEAHALYREVFAWLNAKGVRNGWSPSPPTFSPGASGNTFRVALMRKTAGITPYPK